MTMLTFRGPPPAALDAFLAAQADLDFTYPAVGATPTTAPADGPLGRGPHRNAAAFSVAHCSNRIGGRPVTRSTASVVSPNRPVANAPYSSVNASAVHADIPALSID